MDFSSLVLMELDKNTGAFVKELGSYVVNEDALYVTKMYYDGEIVNLYFDTGKDIEDWEYTAIFDLFDEDSFIDAGYSIEEIDDEYNPTWLVKFNFIEDHKLMEERLNNITGLICEKMQKVFEDIKDKENDYK